MEFASWLIGNWGFWVGWLGTIVLVGLIDWSGIEHGIFGDNY